MADTPRPNDAVRRWHDQLGAMIDQIGQPNSNWKLREMVDGMREMRDEMFALSAQGEQQSGEAVAKPLGYCLLNSAGQMHWNEGCIASNQQELSQDLENLNEDDPDAGWHVAKFYASPQPDRYLAGLEKAVEMCRALREQAERVNDDEGAINGITTCEEAIRAHAEGLRKTGEEKS